MPIGSLLGIVVNVTMISNSIVLVIVNQIVKPMKSSLQGEVAPVNQNTTNMMELTVQDAQQDHGTMLLLMTAFVNGDSLCKITNVFPNLIDCCAQALNF